jgi:hypothetical protein
MINRVPLVGVISTSTVHGHPVERTSGSPRGHGGEPLVKVELCAIPKAGLVV